MSALTNTIITYTELEALFTKYGIKEYKALLLEDSKIDAEGRESTVQETAVVIAWPWYLERKSSQKPENSGEKDANSSKTYQNTAKIASFASRHYYRELVKILQLIVKEVQHRSNIKKADTGIFCNSRISEKSLALAGGLGFRGKNDLVITESYGPRNILAVLKIPFLAPVGTKTFSFLNSMQNASDSSSQCRSCTLCAVACPSGAIKANGSFEKEACLQYWASREGTIPDHLQERWQDYVYGCDNCQSICPKGERLYVDHIEKGESEGVLGFSIDLKFLLTANDEELKTYFHKSALGMGFISLNMLRRNALLCLRHEKYKHLEYLREAYKTSPVEQLRSAARKV